MKLLSQRDYPEGRFTLAFVGYGDDKRSPCIELTFNYETDTYQMGNAFGHVAFGVNDVYAVCERIRQRGGTISRKPGPMKNSSTVLAFITDPDGYKIELIQLENLEK